MELEVQAMIVAHDLGVDVSSCSRGAKVKGR
jgi:hypothetical protein